MSTPAASSYGSPPRAARSGIPTQNLLQRAWCYVAEPLLDPRATPSYIHARLHEDAVAPADEARGARIVQFLSLVCGKIVEREPAALLGPKQGAGATWKHSDPGCRQKRRSSVKSSTDACSTYTSRSLIVSASPMCSGNTNGRPRTDRESCLVAPAGQYRDLDKPTLRQVTADWPADSSSLFPWLREGLFDELGVSMPKFRFAIAAEQRSGSFAFQINDFVSVPVLGLKPGQLMVNETAERLGDAGFADALPIADPATGRPSSVVHRMRRRTSGRRSKDSRPGIRADT